MNGLLFLQHLISDFFISLFYWPFWWYSKGLLYIIQTTWSLIDYYAKSLAINIWVKNIFVPMFGQRDWQSRIISFIVRLANIFFRSLILVIWSTLCLTIPIIYVLILPLTIGFIFINIISP